VKTCLARSLAALTLVFASAASTAHAGLTVVTSSGPLAGGGISYENFNNATDTPAGTLVAGNGGGTFGALTVSFQPTGAEARSGSTDGVAAAPYVVGNSGVPFGDAAGGHLDGTQYLTAGLGSVTMSFSSTQNYLGLLWGSVDTYNVLTFYNGNTVVGTATGSDVSVAIMQDQGASGSAYVNIFSSLAFDRVVASENPSTYAFEFDNLAYGTVPEPASLVMSGMALLTVTGLTLRRRKARVVQA
jgi:hypothetical protein